MMPGETPFGESHDSEIQAMEEVARRQWREGFASNPGPLMPEEVIIPDQKMGKTVGDDLRRDSEETSIEQRRLNLELRRIERGLDMEDPRYWGSY